MNYLIIIVVILIVYFCSATFAANSNNTSHEDFMYGYWNADKGFCNEADISAIMMFIGKPVGKNPAKKKRPAYMLIGDGVMNQPLEINYWKSPHFKSGEFSVSASFDYSEECELPENMTMDFNMAQGTMKLYSGETLYGLFYKDNEISNLFHDQLDEPAGDSSDLE